MILKFATKKDQYGNRYYLILDTEKKIFSENANGFYRKDDYMQITQRERRAIKEKARADGYKEVDFI